MKEPKFSKGVWFIEKSWMDNHVAVSLKDDSIYWGSFANVVTSMAGDNHLMEEGLANAHLIKTAPKLYKMLQDISNSGVLYGWDENIEKLLAEARGEI